MEDILIGTTDRSILVWIPDTDSTVGAGKTGLAHTDMTVSYTRVETDNDVVVTDVTSSLNNLASLTAAHNDWGWEEVSATLSPGLYRLDLADAVFATGAWYGVVQVTITSGLAAATPKAFKLVNFDMFSQAAESLMRAALCIAYGTVTTGASTTSIPTSSIFPTGTDDPNQFIGLVMKFRSDTATTGLRGEGRGITGYNDSTNTFTTDPFSSAPASGDLFVIN